MSGRSAQGGKRDEEGFALLSAISVIALLAMLAAGLSLAMHRDTEIARNLLDTAMARAQSEAGVELAVEGLLVRDPRARWPADGETRVIAFDGATVRVTVEDEAGKIDLNWAPIELVQGLLAQLGVDSARQSAICAEIMARRGAFHMPAQPPGEIMGAALLGGPEIHAIGWGPFGSVDDLLALSDMTRAVYDRTRPFVTVYSQSAHISVPGAPRMVLLSIPGMTTHDADLVMAARRDRSGSGQAPSIPESAGRFAASLDTRAVTITAAAANPSGGLLVRRAVVALTGKPYHPAQFLEWRQEFGESAGALP